MPRNDDDREIGIRQAIGILIRDEVIVRVQDRGSEPGRRSRVKYESMLSRHVVHPVVLLMPAGLPTGGGGTLGRYRHSCADCGAETRNKRTSKHRFLPFHQNLPDDYDTKHQTFQKKGMGARTVTRRSRAGGVAR